MTTDDQAAALARARDSTRDYPRLGSVKVSDLRPEHVEALYLALRRHGKRAGKCRSAGVTCAEHGCRPENHPGLAPKSVQHVPGALRAVLARAVASGALAVNPADDPRAREALPKRTKDTRRVTEGDYWTDAQARAFLASVARDPLRVLWSVALETGLRRGELAGLLWRDVDLDAATIRVRRSTTAVRGAAVSTTGKTDATARPVPLGASTVAALAAEPGLWSDTSQLLRCSAEACRSRPWRGCSARRTRRSRGATTATRCRMMTASRRRPPRALYVAETAG